jgi:lyso-ornithine lipid O-acyltransferase
MKLLRAPLKIFGIVAYTLFCYTIYFIFYLPIKLMGISTIPWKNRLLKFWSAGIALILNLKIRVEGEPPKPPFYLVSNHVSYVDIILLYGILDGTFVAKKEVRSWPFLGFMAQTLGVIFVDRNRKRDVTRVNKEQSSSLKEQHGIILFPEGGTSDGSSILPLRSPLLEVPAKDGIPIHYATIHYETGLNDIPAGESVCWHGDAPLHKHAFLMAGNRKILCTVRFGEKPVQDRDRKELAAKLEERMKNQFEPISTKVRTEKAS